jgi:hypothetical protein
VYSWSDVKKICDDCYALIHETNLTTCRDYCLNQGLMCAGASEEFDDTCVGEKSAAYDCDFNWKEIDTSDALCFCESLTSPIIGKNIKNLVCFSSISGLSFQVKTQTKCPFQQKNIIFLGEIFF